VQFHSAFSEKNPPRRRRWPHLSQTLFSTFQASRLLGRWVHADRRPSGQGNYRPPRAFGTAAARPKGNRMRTQGSGRGSHCPYGASALAWMHSRDCTALRGKTERTGKIERSPIPWSHQNCARWLLLPPHGRRPVRGTPERKKPLGSRASLYTNWRTAIVQSCRILESNLLKHVAAGRCWCCCSLTSASHSPDRLQEVIRARRCKQPSLKHPAPDMSATKGRRWWCRWSRWCWKAASGYKAKSSTTITAL